MLPFQSRIGVVLGRELPNDTTAALATVLEKRHPIAHNLGIVDRKYLLRAQSGELEGREIRIEESELRSAIDVIEMLLADAWQQLLATGPR